MDNSASSRAVRIPLFDKIGYGSGNLGFGLVFQIIGTYVVFYATAVLGIPGSLVGTAVSISVIWDGLTDPLMGYISDVTQMKRYGRRHFYLLIGAPGVALFNYLLWVISPELPVFAKFLWLLANIVIVKTFTTVYATPYTALGAELSSDYNERSAIQGVKTIFFLLGLAFASVAGMFIFFKPTEAYPTGQLNPDAYNNMGLTSSLIMLGVGWFCYFSTRKYIPSLPKFIKTTDSGQGGIISLFVNFLKALNNRYYKYVVFGYLFTNISSALVGTLGLHVFTYTFMLDNRGIAYTVGAQLFVSILSQPLWVRISKRIDKKPSVMLGLLVSITGCVIFLLLVILRNHVHGNFLYMLPFAVLVGFGTGGLYSLPLSMIADTIDYEELHAGIRSEGTYYGCLTLFYKLSQSVAIFMLGFVLDLIRFNANNLVQPYSTVLILGLILGGGALAGFVCALVSYFRYDLNSEKIRKIQEEIRRKSVTQ